MSSAANELTESSYFSSDSVYSSDIKPAYHEDDDWEKFVQDEMIHKKGQSEEPVA